MNSAWCRRGESQIGVGGARETNYSSSSIARQKFARAARSPSASQQPGHLCGAASHLGSTHAHPATTHSTLYVWPMRGAPARVGTPTPRTSYLALHILRFGPYAEHRSLRTPLEPISTPADNRSPHPISPPPGAVDIDIDGDYIGNRTDTETRAEVPPYPVLDPDLHTESLVPMLSLRDVSEQVLKIKAEGLAPRRRPPAQRTQDTRARAPVRICENVSDRASEVDSGDPTIPYQPAMALLHSRKARARPRTWRGEEGGKRHAHVASLAIDSDASTMGNMMLRSWPSRRRRVGEQGPPKGTGQSSRDQRGQESRKEVDVGIKRRWLRRGFTTCEVQADTEHRLKRISIHVYLEGMIRLEGGAY
ncbi:hypothetical protein B0H13DRAFT_1868092 [Mycena leptocephala]|nr:hypothetical protein B0H13DRAFT_1868092 [Mycena leptocephala]